MLILKLVLFALGMFAIVKGADWFTDAAIWVADKTGIPKVIIGATIVSLATTLPEFAVSVYASWSGHAEMALGNAVGSNIFNIGLILGISLLITSFPTDPTVFSKKASFFIIGGILSLILSLDGQLNYLDGIILFAVLIGYIAYLIIHSRSHKSSGNPGTTVEGSNIANLIKFIGGSATVLIGSRIVVNSGVWIAEYFKVPEILIALTLVALGTSLPELVTSLTATLKGYQELSVGNIIGAGILNLSWVIATAAIVNPIPTTKENIFFDLPFMLTLIILLMVFGLTRKRLSKLEGSIFIAIYIVYITLLIGKL